MNFEVIQGSADSKVLLHVPHSSRVIPDAVRKQILLSDADLAAELDSMTDTLTDEVALKAAAQTSSKPWIFINRLSRLVIDPERFPDDREVMNSVGMGAVYRKTSTGTDLRSPEFDGEEGLLNNYFHPYAEAFTELVTQLLDSVGKVTVIDVHSYRPEQHKNAVNHGQKRPAICIGTDAFHTPAWLIEVAEKSFSSVGDTFLNQPYAGTYIPMRYYENQPLVRGLMMETRADTFLTSSLIPHEGLEIVARALGELIEKTQNSSQ